MADVLGTRTLNRTLLARQGLIEPLAMDVAGVAEHLVGLQAQEPITPYIGMWLRLADFDPLAVSGMLERRELVRTQNLRSTIHLVTARDCLRIAPITAPMVAKVLGGRPFKVDLAGLDPWEVAAYGRELIEAQPRTNAQIAPLLGERFPGYEPKWLAMTVAFLVPHVQVPPRGLWGGKGQAVRTTLQAWLGAELDPDPSTGELLLRYLAAFGPASVADMRNWSRLTGLRAAVEPLRCELRVFEDENGRELLDVPGAPFADPATPVRPIFLPEYDNVVLGHDDRSRIVDPGRRPARPGPASGRGGVPGTLLLDGFVGGMWRMTRTKEAAELLVETIAKPSKAEAAAIEGEGEKLLEFLAGDAESRSVRLARK